MSGKTLLMVTLLLCSFATQSLFTARLQSPSSDEAVHLASGYSYLQTASIRLNPQHPPFAKQLAALPLLLLKPIFPKDDPSWSSEPADEWTFGNKFLYGNDAQQLLFWGRMPMLLLGVLLGLLIFVWGTELFGAPSGVLALLLYSFSPNFVAHSHFVTSDVALSFFFTLSLYALWRLTRVDEKKPKRVLITLCGLCLGLALATKFSAVTLLPCYFVLLTLAALQSPRPARRMLQLGGIMLVICLIAGLVVWSTYYFSRDPLFYWRGLAKVNADHISGYPWYLAGEFRVGGWWYYFLAAFFLKTPLPTMLFFIAAVLLAWKYRAESALDEYFLIVPALIFTIVTASMASNIGIRYMLPVYPLIFIFSSRLAPVLLSNKLLRPGSAMLLLWLIAGTLNSFPDQLGYFSDVIGGSKNGHYYLDDSNIDWGQDLPRLRSYIDKHSLQDAKLLYTWPGQPSYYGIKNTRISRQDWEKKPEKGVYIVSTQALIRGLFFAQSRGVNSNWLVRYKASDRIGTSFFVYRFPQ